MASSRGSKTRAAKPSKAPRIADRGDLVAAGRHLEAGAYAAALDGLLGSWEQHRAAETADLIDTLGAWLAGALPPIAGKRTTIDAAWRDIGEHLRPADVPRLIPALDLGSAPQLEGWLDVLVDRFPIDPRLCAPAIELGMKFVSSTAGPTRTRAFRLAEKIADGRCIPQIEKLIAKRSDAWNAKELRDRLRKMLAKFAPPPPLAAADKPVVAALAKQIAKLAKQPAPAEGVLFAAAGKSTRGIRDADVLAEVLANPADDGARLVYADILQQRGDPQGELIALQLQPSLTPAQQKRVDALVNNKAQVAKWLGPLAAVVHEPVFRRGFLAEAKLVLKTARHHTELMQHPSWATVERIDTKAVSAVGSPAMISLRRVHGLPIEDVAELVKQTKPSLLDELGGLVWDPEGELDDGAAHLAAWDALTSVGALTSVRSLGIDVRWQTVQARGIGPAVFDWLIHSRLGKQLERLSVFFSNESPEVAAWLPVFETTQLAQITLRSDAYNFGPSSRPITFAVTARRDGARFAIELQLARIFNKGDATFKLEVRYLSSLLAGFPIASAPALTVRVTTPVSATQLDVLRGHLADTVGRCFDVITVVA